VFLREELNNCDELSVDRGLSNLVCGGGERIEPQTGSWNFCCSGRSPLLALSTLLRTTEEHRSRLRWSCHRLCGTKSEILAIRTMLGGLKMSYEDRTSNIVTFSTSLNEYKSQIWAQCWMFGACGHETHPDLHLARSTSHFSWLVQLFPLRFCPYCLQRNGHSLTKDLQFTLKLGHKAQLDSL